MYRNRFVNEERNFDRSIEEYIRLCNELNETHSLFLRNQYNLLTNIYNVLRNRNDTINQREERTTTNERPNFTQTRTPIERRRNRIHRENTIPQSRLFNESFINELSRIMPRRQMMTYRINLDLGDNLEQLLNMEDVPIIPTREQIENATEEILYRNYVESNNENNLTVCERCPIDLNQFEENDTILKIKHCSHVFKKNNLLEWFSRNSKCPVCRYDIREYPNSRDVSNNLHTENINENTYTNIFRSIFPDVSFSTIH